MTATDPQNKKTMARLNSLARVAHAISTRLADLMRIAIMEQAADDTNNCYFLAIERHLEEMLRGFEKTANAMKAAIDETNAAIIKKREQH